MQQNAELSAGLKAAEHRRQHSLHSTHAQGARLSKHESNVLHALESESAKRLSMESGHGLHRSSSDSGALNRAKLAVEIPPGTASSAELSSPARPKISPGRYERTLSRESVASTSSHTSVASSVARGAKKLYKKPIRRLGKLAHRSKDSSSKSSNSPTLLTGNVAEFVADGDNLSGLTPSPSAQVYSESIDSAGSSTSEEEENIDGEVDKLLENLVIKKQRPDDHDLIIVRNQIRIELKSFKDFLDEATKDPSVKKEDILAVSQRVLDNITQLCKSQDDLLETRKITLERLFNRQYEISAIWENSMRQLELEIQNREKKICDLEDTIRKVRRSLRASVIIPSEKVVSQPECTDVTVGKASKEIKSEGQTVQVAEMPQVTQNKFVSSIQAPDDELTKFLKENDSSEDEFFDAEEEEEEEKEEEEKEREEEEEEGQEEGEELASDTKSDLTLKEDQNEDDGEEKFENEITKEEKPVEGKKEEAVSEAADELENVEEIKRSSISKEGPFHPLKIDSTYVVNGTELVSNAQKSRYERILSDATFKGYEDPIRTTLKKEDDRPKISLWSVLKSLIGKDMTRMTLPVTFNEPTSLLQRNIEIMEYSDILDKAAASHDSCLRMVYVAGFAASEYVSTVGRIAKPFNPLLGETYEYARPEKGYRVFCEQVSHHPPISAVVAESPRWAYYGESNVKTRFYGRSFDIKHLGTWYCELYPDHGVVNKSTGKKESMELYSWKKVNNSVVGIIIGHPTIDNYGQMTIRNHMTGDYMNFSFKRRGWRASTACEVKGDVYSADGTLRYQVGGFWDRKIFAKAATSTAAKKFVIFTANKRQEMLFHLTNFAASLNAPQPHLLPVVACTDTRLRPDQRAMENGQYDEAAEEKNRLEEKQRAVRKQREEGGGKYHPSFFEEGIHPVTKEPYWHFKNTYWEERRDGKLKHYKDIY